MTLREAKPFTCYHTASRTRILICLPPRTLTLSRRPPITPIWAAVFLSVKRGAGPGDGQRLLAWVPGPLPCTSPSPGSSVGASWCPFPATLPPQCPSLGPWAPGALSTESSS